MNIGAKYFKSCYFFICYTRKLYCRLNRPQTPFDHSVCEWWSAVIFKHNDASTFFYNLNHYITISARKCARDCEYVSGLWNIEVARQGWKNHVASNMELIWSLINCGTTRSKRFPSELPFNQNRKCGAIWCVISIVNQNVSSTVYHFKGYITILALKCVSRECELVVTLWNTETACQIAIYYVWAFLRIIWGMTFY
jgi:hypothetical protein